MDSQVVHLTENLFKQSTTDLSDLKPNTEYCVIIKVGTSAGESGFSNSILLPCKYSIILAALTVADNHNIIHFGLVLL